MKIGFVSLGCSKNQLDTEVMLHELMSAGYEITPEETEADIVIVNTCGFIGDAKEESVNMILQMAERKKAKKLRKLMNRLMNLLMQRLMNLLLKKLVKSEVLNNEKALYNSKC